MVIRKATVHDLDGLHRLLTQVGEVHHLGRPDLFKEHAKKYDNEQLIELLNDPKRPVFCAVDENEWMMGYAFCMFQQHLHHSVLTDIKTLYIDDLCVDESCRNQHIGKALYQYVLNYAKQKGIYNVTLNVWGFNESAIRFYESCGLSVQKIGMEQIIE
ncbi:MAG: GNAT family N-acetyltransferase [Erysipelotrichaceae bacterium]|nr:GNAT family N-acetyltransferase [Erysipelotrichaceae bacterium]